MVKAVVCMYELKGALSSDKTCKVRARAENATPGTSSAFVCKLHWFDLAGTFAQANFRRHHQQLILTIVNSRGQQIGTKKT